MKKLVIMLVIVMSFLYINFILKNKEAILEVSYLETLDKNEQQIFKIDISSNTITTKNIFSLLENLSLKRMEYSVPKLYQKLFYNWNLEYEFEDKNIKRGISKIEALISNQFKKNGYQKEVEKIYFYGLKIKTIEVYGSYQEIIELKNRIKSH